MTRLEFRFHSRTMEALPVSTTIGQRQYVVHDSALFANATVLAVSSDLDVRARCAHLSWDEGEEHLRIDKGPLCPFRLFFGLDGTSLVVSDFLGSFKSSLDRAGFVTFLAACSRGPVEPLSSSATSLSGVHRATAGFVTSHDGRRGRLTRHPVRWAAEHASSASHDDVVCATRQAAAELVSRLDLGSRNVGLELSGGMDSTLSGLLWRESSNADLPFAWTIRYPFYEFRREGSYIHAARRLVRPLAWQETNGTDLVPFSLLPAQLTCAEPSLAMLGIAQARALFENMSGAGVDISLNGNGGDTLYEVGARGLGPVDSHRFRTPDWLARRTRDHFAQALEDEWAPLSTVDGCQQIFESGITLDDMSLEANLQATYQVRRLSLVSSVKLLGVIRNVLPEERSAALPRPGREKWALRQLLRHYGDDVLSSRVGKVPYDALFATGLIAHFDDIMRLVDKAEDALQDLGVEVRVFQTELHQARDHHRLLDNFAAGVIAFSQWLRSTSRLDDTRIERTGIHR